MGIMVGTYIQIMIMKAGNFDFVFAKRMIMVRTLFCRSFGGNELASKRRRPEDLKIGHRLILDQKLDLAIINCQSTYMVHPRAESLLAA